jgi:oxaloacetate decarboxylase (Na+ extruding) subunit alpha
MLAAGPAHDQFNPELVPVLDLLRELGDRKTVHDLAVTKPGLHLSVRRRPEGSDRA